MKRCQLEYPKGLLQKIVYSLEEETTIGRAGGNTICLEDSEVSREHARIRMEDGRFVLTDLQSRNGTFVNESRTQRQTLRPGDEIRIGRTTLRYIEPDAPSVSLDDTATGTAEAEPSREIQEEIDLVKTFLDALPLGVAIVTHRLMVRYGNQSLSELCGSNRCVEGMSLGDPLGCPVHQTQGVECGDLDQCAQCPFHAAAQQIFVGRASVVDSEVSWSPRGRSAPIYLRFSMTKLPYRLTGEDLVQLTLEDITARVTDQEALERSRNELERRVEDRTAELKTALEGLQQEIIDRQNVDKALRESEIKYRLVVDNAHDAIAVAQDGILKFVNPRAAELAGVPEAELSGQPIEKYLHPDDRGMVLQNHRERLRGVDLPNAYRFRMQRQDGQTRRVELHAVPISWEGRPAVLGFMADVTERERAEAELAKLSFVVEEMVDGIVITDMGGEIIHVNRALSEMLGWRGDDQLGKTPAEYIVENDLPEYTRLIDEVVQGYPSPKSSELRVRRKDGTEIPISANFCVIPDQHGDSGEIVTVIRDMTDLKQAQDALRESEAKYRQIVDCAPAGIYEIDLRGGARFVSVNDVMCEYTGYTKEEFLQVRPWDLLTPESREKQMKRYAMIIKGEAGPGINEFEALRKDGSKFWILVNTNFLYENGIPVRATMVAHDITERKHLEHQLQQAQKIEAIGRLAGGVAHDFNNILTSIIGHTDLVLLSLDPQSPLRANVQEIKRAGERAASLTRQLLAFSRKQMLQPRVLVLNDVIRDLEPMLTRLIGEDIELRTVLDPKPGKVEADPGQIEQVIMNLAVNARDAMPNGGKLTLETRNVLLDRDYQRKHDVVQPGPYLLLAMSDSGSGMDKATQSRIFEPFFTTKELGKGTGLGLATVYGIIKQSGGYIWVYSEPDRGTTFKVYLPTVDARVEDEADEPSPARSLQGSETVLVVEDDDTVRNLSRNVLQEYGYRVLEASDGAEAIEVVRANRDPVHLVVTDVVMPGLSAREMVERLQSLRPGIRVLYMSGYTESAIVHRGVLHQDISFLQKPFTPRELAGKVREILDGGATSESASP